LNAGKGINPRIHMYEVLDSGKVKLCGNKLLSDIEKEDDNNH